MVKRRFTFRDFPEKYELPRMRPRNQKEANHPDRTLTQWTVQGNRRILLHNVYIKTATSKAYLFLLTSRRLPWVYELWIPETYVIRSAFVDSAQSRMAIGDVDVFDDFFVKVAPDKMGEVLRFIEGPVDE